MNILDVVPGIGGILDKVITSPKELEELKVRLAEINAREIEARLSVQKEWLGNKSVFVAGAIPMILWMVSIVVFFNCIISPLLAPVWEMPVIDLPTWYSDLAITVILGLFVKKSFDGNTIKAGSFMKPAKGREEDVDEAKEQEEHEVSRATAATVEPTEKKAPVAGKAAAPKNKSAAAAPAKGTYDTQEAVNARFDEIVKEYEGKKK